MQAAQIRATARRFVALDGETAAGLSSAEAEEAETAARECGKASDKSDRTLLDAAEKQVARVVGPSASAGAP